ncbi:unnamed protein product [Ranitomeya imitator]|uniref:Integrase catalytic domain-containing protein n=1 Tax=Ranitomeya imitator TaxID=111125 RepID=A0ABN9L799_9NEOB|nr:unnamed protein product [Ranitomeya imitator]
MVAILKVKAHGKLKTVEAGGNNMADMAAKEAAKGRQYGEVGEVIEPDSYFIMTRDKKPDKMMTWDLFKKLQAQAPKEEKENWMWKGATHEEGIRNGFQTLPTLVVQWAHEPTHRSKTQMNDLIGTYWFAPGISTLTAKFTSNCLICGKCNLRQVEKVPPHHLARPLYPLQRNQIDHIQMPPSGAFEYALFVVHVFSGWPEAFPVRNLLAKTTAKKLLRSTSEIVCRYGVPEVIARDQGPTFSANLTQETWSAVGADKSLQVVYNS